MLGNRMKKLIASRHGTNEDFKMFVGVEDEVTEEPESCLTPSGTLLLAHFSRQNTNSSPLPSFECSQIGRSQFLPPENGELGRHSEFIVRSVTPKRMRYSVIYIEPQEP